MTALAVFLGEDRAGSLSAANDGGLVFSYESEWLQKEGAIPLSRQLPLQSEPYKGNAAAVFFKGVLPEEEPRQRIASILGISPGNDFGLLERIGGECAGAVNVWAEGQRPAAGSGASPRWLSHKELTKILRELPRRPLMAGEAGVRLSLAGAQAKLPVIVASEETADYRIALPMGGAPSTHILKPEPERFPGLAANEFFCMSLAKAVGLKVPEVRYGVMEDVPYVLVERYDRVITEGGVLRVHQEDFCQALGVPPERKYQQEGGPSLMDCIRLLREWSTVPVLDVREFIDGLIFNVLIGNADAHAKNFSLLYGRGSRRLAPLYDLVCTRAWPELSRLLSMKIGPAAELNEVIPDHFRIFSERANLGWPMVRERLATMCEAIVREAENDEHVSDLPRSGLIEPAQKIVAAQAERMRRLL